MSCGRARRLAHHSLVADASRVADSWRAIACRHAPSWLASAVLHLSAMILLGLLFQSGEPVEINQISLSWAADDSQSTDNKEAGASPVRIEPPAAAAAA